MEHRIVIEDIKYIVNSKLPWQKLNNKTVMVTGANGFLPSFIVKTLLLLNRKIEVIGIVRDRHKAERRFKDYLKRADFQLVIQDVTKPFLIKKNIDYIIHAASIASPKYYTKDPVGTLLPNILGTYHLLELARKKRLSSFLFFSSGEVYGLLLKNKIPIKENDFGSLDPTNLRACYAESKRMAENMCFSYMHQYQIPIKIVRFFHSYGPGMAFNDGRVHADFVSDIVQQRNIVVKSDGKARRTFCYFADAISGFFTVMLKGENGNCYNIGNEKEEISVGELAALLVKLFPEKQLKVIYQPRDNRDNYLESKLTRVIPDTSKLRALDWQPKYPIKEGFLRTIKSYFNES